jgi:hypothetical protein
MPMECQNIGVSEELVFPNNETLNELISAPKKNLFVLQEATTEAMLR